MEELKTYYFTFGQQHPLRDNWIEIQAVNADTARKRMFELFGAHWAFQYSEADFKPDYFPSGRAGISVDV